MQLSVLSLVIGGLLVVVGMAGMLVAQTWRDRRLGEIELAGRQAESRKEYHHLYLVNPMVEFVCGLLAFADELEDLVSEDGPPGRSGEEILRTRLSLLTRRSITLARASALEDDELHGVVNRLWHRWLVFLEYLDKQELAKVRHERETLYRTAGEVLRKLEQAPVR